MEEKMINKTNKKPARKEIKTRAKIRNYKEHIKRKEQSKIVCTICIKRVLKVIKNTVLYQNVCF